MSASPACDYSVCQTWGFKEGDWYLLDVLRERYDFPDLVSKAKSHIRAWSPDMIIIEDGGTGKPLYQELRKANHLRKLNLMKPALDKEIRMRHQTVKLAQGGFFLPNSAPWLKELKNEWQGFPKARYDDQVDTLSQFLASLDTRRGHALLNPSKPAVIASRRYARRRLIDY